jgi:hypothetical protein
VPPDINATQLRRPRSSPVAEFHADDEDAGQPNVTASGDQCREDAEHQLGDDGECEYGLQLLMPGETAAPERRAARGSLTAQTAGIPLNVTVNAVDAN